jgi:TonB-linked SusC/RagA family outer membrane protein
MKKFRYYYEGNILKFFSKKTIRVMKLTLFLSMLTIFQLWATETYSQLTKLTLSLENIRIADALREIENQSEFYFLYSPKLIDVEKKVNIYAEKEPIKDILTRIFGKEVKFIVYDRQVILTSLTESEIPSELQQRKIEGKVTDKSGVPLPGVSVVIKGTTIGTTTDTDGNFALTVPPDGDILIFSFIGMNSQEVTIADQTLFNIVLIESALTLDEVVVIGYGTQKKVNLTGAVTAIKGDQLMNKPVTGTVDALQGIMPGTVITRESGSPGNEKFNIQIRGLTSINNNPVLVLINGIEGSIEDVRPEDVESISVLKDASSAAIYGAKAAGGVILVTTKSGKSGKVLVEINSSYSLSVIGRAPERPSSYDLALARKIADTNAGRPFDLSEEDLAKLRDGNVPWEENPAIPGTYRYWGNHDYTELVLKNPSPRQSHNIVISGGTEETNFRLSTIYYRNDGIIKIGPDNNEKYSGRFNLNTHIGKYLSLSNELSYNYNQINKPQTDVSSMFYYVYTYPGVTPLYDPNGNPAWGAYVGAYDGRVKFYQLSSAYGYNTSNLNNVRASSTLTIDHLVKGLQFRLVGAADANFNTKYNQTNPIYHYGMNGSPVGYISTTSQITKGHENSGYIEFQFLTDYDLKIGNHSIHALAGYSFQDYRFVTFGAQALKLINPDVPDFNWASKDNIALADEVQTNAFQSFFGRLQYNYKERYLVEGDVRYDGSSKLAPDNRYKWFPSASAAWRVSQEPWFPSDYINELKLRASWGQLGNAGVLGNYDYIALLSTSNDLLQGINGTVEQQASYVAQKTLASENITWETVQSSNIGIDFGFFKNKLTLSGDYFIKRNKNMLAMVEYPSVIGVGLPNLNAGELKTWGWEAQVAWKDHKGAVDYWISANIADSKNEVVSYLGATTIRPGTNRLIEGMPYNSIFGYKTDGLFQTQEEVSDHVFQDNRTGPGDIKYIDLNNDNKISAGSQTIKDHGDLVYLGNTSPRYSFGLSGGLYWKSFDASVFFQGVGKRVFMPHDAEKAGFSTHYNFPNKTQMDFWTTENPDASFPRAYSSGSHNFLPSDYHIQGGAYIRLKDIQVGYTLPGNLLSKVGIEKFRVYIAGHDIWEWTKTFDYIDPEDVNERRYLYPFLRTYTAGINLSF